MKHPLTPAQVAVLRPLYERMKRANADWHAALVLLGIDEIVGGDLDADEPYLEVADG